MTRIRTNPVTDIAAVPVRGLGRLRLFHGVRMDTGVKYWGVLDPRWSAARVFNGSTMERMARLEFRKVALELGVAQ